VDNSSVSYALSARIRPGTRLPHAPVADRLRAQPPEPALQPRGIPKNMPLTTDRSSTVNIVRPIIG